MNMMKYAFQHFILSIDGYDIVGADHPFNPKDGGVCIYFKRNLKLRQINTLHIF